MYNIETLAKMSGLTRRTIRYYIQRELLDPPRGSGRGAFYTDDHLERLHKIKVWAAQGVPIIHMKAMLQGKTPRITVDSPTGVRTILEEQYVITNGIRLSFSPGQFLPEELLTIREFIMNIINRREE